VKVDTRVREGLTIDREGDAIDAKGGARVAKGCYKLDGRSYMSAWR